MNTERFIESHKIHVSTYSLTSVGTTMTSFNTNDCSEVSVIVGCGTVVAGVQSTVTIDQGNEKTLATAAGLSSATLFVLIGSSSTGRVERASDILLTLTSSTATVLIVNGITLTQTSATASFATTNTTGGFGSTVGTTLDTGQQLLADSLIARLNSTYGSSIIGPGGLGSIMRATSGTTATVAIRALDGENLSSGITVLSNSTLISPAYVAQQVALSFKTDELNSTSNFFKVNISTASSVARACNVTVIKSGLRYGGKSNVYGDQKIST